MVKLKKDRIPVKESLILLVFLSILLFLPLGILYFFENSWGELIWHNPTDIAMLEWTGAFLNIFLFLLMLENYRTTGRVLFNFIASGFLAMGILNFIYAIHSPGTETAMWIRTFSIMAGAILFSFSIPTRKWEKFDLTGALIKFVIPAILLSSLAGWVPFSLKQILPKLLNTKGNITLFGSILFLIPCALFFFTALIWLHEYIKHKRRVDFLIFVIILIFAQMTLMIRDSRTWGVLWWLWHIIWVVDLLIAAIYMLILSVNRSLVWKLVLSLGLAFSLTVMIASSILQSHSEKYAQQTFRTKLHNRHRKVLISNSINLKYANFILKTISQDAESFSTETDSVKPSFNSWMTDYFKKRNKEWNPICSGYGFCSATGKITFSGLTESLSETQRTFILEFINNKRKLSNNISWSRFYYSTTNKKWYSLAAKKFHNKNINGFFFVNVDVSGLVMTSLLNNDQPYEEKSIVFHIETGEVLHVYLSKKDILDNDKKNFRDKVKRTFVMKLTALVSDINEQGRIIIADAEGNKYFISAQRIQNPALCIMKIIHMKKFPKVKTSSRYFFIAVAMITLLCGFIILLVLLHRQLSRPLNRLLNATVKLEKGDFDVKIKTKDETEIGSIAKAFNNMSGTLKTLYSDLATTVTERTEALEDAKKADSAKVTFFQNMSHELRTPLHGIISFSRLGMRLKEDEPDEKVKRYFKNINDSGERLMMMIDSILDLAKLESGNMSFNFRMADIVLCLSKVKDELEGAFLEKEIKIIITYPEDERILTYIDTDMMERVFRNLLGNALKLSPVSSKIEVKLEKLEDQIKVSVIDQGPGIPKEAFNDIFNKFVQLGDGQKKGGTGLGLPICREIIHAHGGLISAKNNKAKGACFTFSIPIRTMEENEKKSDKE